MGKNRVVNPEVQHIYDECVSTSQSVGTGEDQDNRSALSRALNIADYPGRVRGKGHGVTPTSLYKHPRRRNPTNQEVMQIVQELQAQVRELQRDKEIYMADKCSTSQFKETSDKSSINCQNKFPEVIINSFFLLFTIVLFLNFLFFFHFFLLLN